jgi:hypothetical protein
MPIDGLWLAPGVTAAVALSSVALATPSNKHPQTGRSLLRTDGNCAKVPSNYTAGSAGNPQERGIDDGMQTRWESQR